MKNRERFAAPYLLATNTNGIISAAGLQIGPGGNADGSVVCIKTNGGTVIPFQAPSATTQDTVSASAEEETGESEQS